MTLKMVKRKKKRTKYFKKNQIRHNNVFLFFTVDANFQIAKIIISFKWLVISLMSNAFSFIFNKGVRKVKIKNPIRTKAQEIMAFE